MFTVPFRILLCNCLFVTFVYPYDEIKYDVLSQEDSLNTKMEKIEGIVNKQGDEIKILRRIKKALETQSSNNISSTSPIVAATPTTPVSIPKNNTEFVSNHTYYVSSYKGTLAANSPYFKDLRIMKNNNNTNVTLSVFRANTPGSIQYVVKNLKFLFPFYGHEVSRVVVMTAGFLHIGPIIHQFATDVHYVAPLMANFTPIGNRTSNIYTYDDGNRFIAQWDSVLEAKQNVTDPFTFQVSIFRNGSIYFAYKTIPYSVSQLVSKTLTTKVGLSDAYIYKYFIYVRGFRFGPFWIIVHYDTVSLPKEKVVSNSAYILNPIPNCITAKSCNACFSEEIAKNFKCKWCPKIKLCSDSLDWHRQRWLQNGCPFLGVSNKASCNAPPKTMPPFRSTKGKDNHGKTKPFKSNKERHSQHYVGVIIGVLVIFIVLIVAGILFYGYKNPNSRIGMFMIEHRPAKLFRRI